MICTFEAVKNEAYKDSRGIPTIGIGFIKINGVPVKMGMKMTDEQIEAEFDKQIVSYENGVNKLVTSKINQAQFDSLVSFVYNLGVASLASSTLLKKINANPNDPTIDNSWNQWINQRINGKLEPCPGLINRRRKEANHYFGK